VSPVLRFEGVWKGFTRGRDWVSVLEDVSLEVRAGQVAAVVGARSQGKSTLIRIATGTLRPDRGSVSIEGRELADLSGGDLAELLRTEIGIAGRDGEDLLNVRDYVAFSLAATRKYSGRERDRLVKDVLAELEVSGCAGSKWPELSDWEQVLVEFAQAIVRRPRLLLVDDVVDGMGLDQKRAAMDLLEGFAKERRCAVLMAVSDHAAALRSATVWQLSHTKLTLMHQDPDIIHIRADKQDRAL
jgi:ABC-type lipoprotein export system ATPase subunit